MQTDDLERVEAAMTRRHRMKKLTNLVISGAIVVLGICSVLYIWCYDAEGILTFRWLTVDGTLFSVLCSAFYLAVGVYELLHNTELTSRVVYFVRLSSAVAECLIIVVVLLSWLPFSPQHLHLARIDMFQMHVVIPLLTILSFLTNDSPIGRLTAGQKLTATSFVTLYAIVLLTLVLTSTLSQEQIPYYFFDVLHVPALTAVLCFAFVYVLSFAAAHLFSHWNRRLSWLWFRGIGKQR